MDKLKSTEAIRELMYSSWNELERPPCEELLKSIDLLPLLLAFYGIEEMRRDVIIMN